VSIVCCQVAIAVFISIVSNKPGRVAGLLFQILTRHFLKEVRRVTTALIKESTRCTYRRHFSISKLKYEIDEKLWRVELM
jgi:hypothetical protein